MLNAFTEIDKPYTPKPTLGKNKCTGIKDISFCKIICAYVQLHV